jgi:FAD/FMN-containing dehydrogenase
MALVNTWKEELSALVGEANVIDDSSLFSPYTDDFTDHYKSEPLAVVRPGSTEEVAAVVRWCAAHKVPLFPQGGNTGLTGAASTYEPGKEIIISLRRMNKKVSDDVLNNAFVVQAGMTLLEVQNEAEKLDRLFPLSFGAEGNATIGGCLACNAGGVAVLRYGTTRELVLGLEVVLPDGRILNLKRSLRKDNTGYDLKDLFVGSEGTLGIITECVLKLFPVPAQKETALVAVEDDHKALKLLELAQKNAASSLTAFELIHKDPIERVRKYLPQIPVPELTDAPWYVLMELSLEKARDDSLLEAILEEAFEREIVADAVLAQSQKQQKELWHIRESIPLADRTAGGSIHSDVSLPISSIPEFIDTTRARLAQTYPWLEDSIYGHLGDGNLHYNFVSTTDPTLTFKNEAGIRDILYGSVAAFNGSISAEHGIGQLKKEHNTALKNPLELEIMQKIKTALDPDGLFNPGKLF